MQELEKLQARRRKVLIPEKDSLLMPLAAFHTHRHSHVTRSQPLFLLHNKGFLLSFSVPSPLVPLHAWILTQLWQHLTQILNLKVGRKEKKRKKVHVASKGKPLFGPWRDHSFSIETGRGFMQVQVLHGKAWTFVTGMTFYLAACMVLQLAPKISGCFPWRFY